MTDVAAAAANVVLITCFYEALGRRDAETMVRCYVPDAHFCDPVFGGWLPQVQNSIRAQAAKGLAAWRDKHAAARSTTN